MSQYDDNNNDDDGDGGGGGDGDGNDDVMETRHGRMNGFGM